MSETTREPHLIDASAGRVGRGRVPVLSATSTASQWRAFFLAPATFFAHLQLAYVLVPWSCARHTQLWLHLTGLLAVALAALGTFLCWRVWATEGREPPGQAGGPAPRARFVALTGMAMGGLFVILLAAQWAASLFLSPCQ